MDNLLIISSSEKSAKTLSALLSPGFHIVVTKSGSEARRALLEADFDLLVINTPLSDEFGYDLAIWASERTIAGIMLLVKEEIADPVSEKVEDCGVFVVTKPLNRQSFFSALKLIQASRKRMTGLQNENRKLQQRLEDMKTVNRAKWMLVEKEHMSEPEAHSYIEQEAMNSRLSKGTVAAKILKRYEETC